jgi:hypothetical protein
VSDRESITLSPGDHTANISHAKSLQREEMMPRSAFWAPITASRYLSLFDVDGDDFFSSDLTGDTGLHLLVAYSKKDEYVPENVNKDVLLRRLVSAMNGIDHDNDGNADVDDQGSVAGGLMLENSNHNLSTDDGDREKLVEALGELLMVE